jgi:hypothetical protein
VPGFLDGDESERSASRPFPHHVTFGMLAHGCHRNVTAPWPARRSLSRHAAPDKPTAGSSTGLVVEYEPRSGLRGLYDRLLLRRGVERALRQTFANFDATLAA